MNAVETDRDGAMKYQTELCGRLDGCRFEVLYYTNGEMICSLMDQESQVAFECLRLQVSLVREIESDYLLVQKMNSDSEVVGTVFDGDKIVPVKESHLGELMDLSVWWLANNLAKRVSLNGADFFTEDSEEMLDLERTLIQGSWMDAFYEGKEIPLGYELYVQVKCEKDLEQDYWEIETVIKDAWGETVAMIAGKLIYDSEGTYRLTNEVWESDWETDNLCPDILALELRYITNKFDNVLIEEGEITVEFDEEDMRKRSSYWLGF